MLILIGLFILVFSVTGSFREVESQLAVGWQQTEALIIVGSVEFTREIIFEHERPSFRKYDAAINRPTKE
ncbi:MAG: hypothetical protein K0Q51_253 [Rickettsiaceae bacterium]|jgi:flagellar motor component MotA|nr:hypothetical protein [Rickettsiaceae bacterium]